ncbi:MAG: transporter substrate-binding domain-containing protein [Rhodoferax sp.]|nr:transporter substrate-binding domain-containing protein [Rhodoferax sp.]
MQLQVAHGPAQQCAILRPAAAGLYGAVVLALALCQPARGADTVQRLVIGTPAGLPGYELVDDNQLKISDPYKKAFTDCIASRLNAGFVWQSLPTKRVLQMLEAGEIDMAYPMGFTEERAASLLPSSPAWQNPDVLVSLHAVDMRDLHLRLAARLGSPQHADYLAEGYARVTGVYAYEELAGLLERAQVDVVIVPRSVYAEQKALWPPKAMVTAGKPRASGFYLNKDDPKKLQKPLNAAIARCKDASSSR